jgi:hypothetical protein
MKKQPLHKRKKSECKLIEIIKEPERLDSYKKEQLFEQWKYIFNFYKKLLEEDKRESQFGTPLGYVFLGVLAEGLVKIILFFDNPTGYLGIEQRDRTLGKLKGRLKNLLKDHKEESNETKIKELEDSLSSDGYFSKCLRIYLINSHCGNILKFLRVNLSKKWH